METHIWYYKCDRDPVSWELIGPNGEPTTVILLIGYSIKLSSNYASLYPQISIALIPHQRSFPLLWTVVNSEGHNSKLSD